MRAEAKAHLRELLYRIGVFFKALDAFVELVGGIALWLIPPGVLMRTVHMLTEDEISEDPHDLVANLLRHMVHRLSLSSEHFIAIYLLIHGIVKAMVVGALLTRRLWAFPLSIFVFLGFIAYQLYRFTLTGSLGLVALSAFDAVVVVLICLEYRALRAEAQRKPGNALV